MRSDPGILHALECPNHETLVLSYSGCTPGSDLPKDLLLSKIHHCLRKYCLFSCACATHLSSTYFPALHRFLGSYCLSELLHGGRSVTAEAIRLILAGNPEKSPPESTTPPHENSNLKLPLFRRPKAHIPFSNPKTRPHTSSQYTSSPPQPREGKTMSTQTPFPLPSILPPHLYVTLSINREHQGYSDGFQRFRQTESRREKRKGSREV